MNLSLSLSCDQPQCWSASLHLLYRPLIGGEACMLYTVLSSLAQYTDSLEMDDLLAFAQCTKKGFEEARTRLEEFELLRSYADDSGKLAHLEIRPVLLPAVFLNHDIYRRILFQAIGSEGMIRLKALVLPANAPQEGLREVSSSLSAERLACDWSAQQETQLSDVFSDFHDPQQYDFDWGVFFLNMHQAIPQRLRSRENMTRIARLASIYGLDELSMRKVVIKHLRDRRTWIDFDAIIEELGYTNRIQDVDPNDYSQPPVAFLKARQPKNAEILPKERALLLSLAERHQFSNELINTIIEYSMEQCQGSLVEKYVRTLANNMARSQIETRDQALEYFSRQKKAVSSRKGGEPQLNLPDWYSIIPDEQASEEDLQAVLALQEQILKGNRDHGSH